jgi:hypothetical protein
VTIVAHVRLLQWCAVVVHCRPYIGDVVAHMPLLVIEDSLGLEGVSGRGKTLNNLWITSVVDSPIYIAPLRDGSATI